MSVVQAAKHLVELQPAHPVVSLYLDLDPEEFATPKGRMSQIDSLLDGAHKRIEASPPADHEAHMALRADLDRVREYLTSDAPPFQGARALAVFCSVRDDVFEVVQLSRAVAGRVAVGARPFVEPLIRVSYERQWCVALVSRRDARILSGPAERLGDLRSFKDDIRGQHKQGGWSQTNYERSIEKDVDDHLRRVAEALHERWRVERYDRLALGGPVEDVSRLEGFLHNDVRAALIDQRLDLDLSSVTPSDVCAAVADLIEEDKGAHVRAALDRLAEGIGSGRQATGGPSDVVAALNERRVETLLLDEQFDRAAGRCAACGVLTLESSGPCPTGDGGEIAPIEHLREAAIESAVLQDAEVIVVTRHPDLGTYQGIAALLRF